MSRNDNSNENAGAKAPAPAAPPTRTVSVEERIAPLDEFRGRAESWMKEITAQVARLASRAEQDDKRRGGLDKKLGDIEDRLKSLLTLTELLSLQDNPFASRNGDAPQAASSPAFAAPKAVAPTAVASPAPLPAAAAPAPAPTPLAPRPLQATHPNDAHAEPTVAAPAHPPARPSAREDAASDPGMVEYLNVIEWAELLAPNLPHLDLGAFLGFYVETGWIEPARAASVRNLALQLRADPRYQLSEDRISLGDLHRRSVRLLAGLKGPTPPPALPVTAPRWPRPQNGERQGRPMVAREPPAPSMLLL